MKIYVINLPKDKERKSFQENQLKSFNLDYEIISAVTVADISKQIYEAHKNDWQRPLRDVEIACFYSHYHLWQRILEQNRPALILEDDALLSKCLPKILNDLFNEKDIDYINMEVVGRKKIVSKKSKAALSCNTQLYRLYLDRNGTGGYILYPSGAKKLLALEEKIGIGLADAHINTCTDLAGYQIEPAAVIQLDQCQKCGITPPLEGLSNIGTQEKPAKDIDKTWYFASKRMTEQLRQGFQHIRYLFHGEKREIQIRIEDFVFSKKKENEYG